MAVQRVTALLLLAAVAFGNTGTQSYVGTVGNVLEVPPVTIHGVTTTEYASTTINKKIVDEQFLQQASTISPDQLKELMERLDSTNFAGAFDNSAISVEAHEAANPLPGKESGDEDVVLYAAHAPSWDEASAPTNSMPELPAMEPLPPPPPRPEAPPPLPVDLTPAGEITNCKGGHVTDLDAYARCTSIDGGLFIMDMEVTSLDALKNVQSVTGGGIQIGNNKNLKDISGLSGVCGSLSGHLNVLNNPKLNNLNAFECISGATAVNIGGNEALKSVQGLKNVCGKLQDGLGVKGNPLLDNLSGLDCISSLGGNEFGVALEVDANPSLKSLQALAHVSSLNGSTVITNNPLITTIAALLGVKTVGKDKRDVSLVLTNNAKLEKCDAFWATNEFPGGVQAANLPQLQSMDCLNGVVKVGKDENGVGVMLYNTPKLQKAGMDQLKSVAGSIIAEKTGIPYLTIPAGKIGVDKNGHSLVVGENPQLRGIEASKLITSPGAVQIYDNKALKTIEAGKLASVGTSKKGVSEEFKNLPKLTQVTQGKNVVLHGGVALVNTGVETFSVGQVCATTAASKTGNCVEVEGNSNLARPSIGNTKLIGGAVFKGNKKLETTGLTKVESIGANNNGQSLVAQKNERMSTYGAERLVKLAGSIVASELPAMEMLLGLEKVEVVGTDVTGTSLEIAHNQMLKTLSGLRSCSKFEGALVVQKNPMLRTLEGLQALTQIGCTGCQGRNILGDSILIYSNPELMSLKGLENLHGELAGALSISNNPKLLSIEALKGITNAGSNVAGHAIELVNNKRLHDLTGLDDITAVLKGALSLQGNGIQSLKGLCGLTGISGQDISKTSVAIRNNEQLTDINCLSHLGGALKGKLVLENNPIESVTPLLKGSNALVAANGVQVNLVHCLTAGDHAKLEKLCVSSSCKNSIQSVTKCAATRSRFHTAQASAHVLVGAGKGRVCGGSSDAKQWQTWSRFGTSGLFVDVDTSSCNFKMTPAYVASVQGDAGHFQLVGVNSIYSATKGSFRVYLWHPVLRGAYLRYFAERYAWKINWLADTGKSAGITKPGQSGWKQYAKDTIYVDVDTTNCGYKSSPSYITSIHGSYDHWRVQGVHAIYSATATGFRVFVASPAKVLSAKSAEQKKWAVSWVGSEDSRYAGVSSNTWSMYCASKDSICAPTAHYFSLYNQVDTSARKFYTTPSYVTSITGLGHHLVATGGAAVYRPTKDSFRVYLQKAPTPKIAQESNWRVNYIAYEQPVDCQLSDWGQWTACTASCDGGARSRTRSVVRAPNHSGSCPSLKQEGSCNSHACPGDCVWADWGSWSKCDKTCGEGLQRRSRITKVDASAGGKPCIGSASHDRLCEEMKCPLHCVVSDWSQWGGWSTSCGNGLRSRSRWIEHHPAHGGTECPNALTQTGTRNGGPCPVDCVVGNWGSWSGCSVTCGSGKNSRTRALTQPTHGGVACPIAQDEKPCVLQPCPVDCVMSAWKDWSLCSKSCGTGGTQFTTRTITTQPQHGGKACENTRSEVSCFEGNCPVHCHVSSWSTWTGCSLTCGGGSKSRSRSIVTHARHGGYVCPHLAQQESCSIAACPVDCVQTQWSAWTACTKSCDTGSRTRSRSVKTPAQYGGVACGASERVASCNTFCCPRDCDLSAWDSGSACSKTCGTGKRTFTRQISVHPRCGGQECEHLSEKRDCKDMSCPIHCAGTWSIWSDCSTTCGSGTTFRTHTVTVQPKHGGTECPGPVETKSCATKPCPVDCLVHDWGTWESCSATCGGGVSVRTRGVKRAMDFGGKKCAPLSQTQPCKTQKCPVDCRLSQWGSWGACSKSCNTGSQVRFRVVETPAAHGGTPCGALTEQQPCRTRCCPGQFGPAGACTDCATGQYQDAHSMPMCKHCIPGRYQDTTGQQSCKKCSVGTKGNHQISTASSGHCIDCKPGTYQRYAGAVECVQCKPGQYLKDHRAPGPCEKCPAGQYTNGQAGSISCINIPVPCVLETEVWSKWTGCTKSCGGGIQSRSRTVISPAKYGGTCPPIHEGRACKTHACPVDCETNSWGQWPTNGCSKSCGTGEKTRSRTIKVYAQFGGKACGPLGHTVQCNKQPCPVDCVWGPFSAWTPCLNQCGPGGKQQRSRGRAVTSRHGGVQCNDKDATDTRQCPDKPPCAVHCEVSDWTDPVCSRSCGGGKRTLHRSVIKSAAHGGKACPVLSLEVDCNSQPCPADCDFSWLKWSLCSASCGFGKQTRLMHIASEPQFGGARCPTQRSETRVCNDHQCPFDCVMREWGQWGSCSSSCDGGRQARSRTPLYPARNGGASCGVTSEARSCDEGPCPVHCSVSSWGSYDACTKSCGGGTWTRTRHVTKHPHHGGYLCPFLKQTVSCNTQNCPRDCLVGQWSSWGLCDASCGGGESVRTRQVTLGAKYGGVPCGQLSQLKTCRTFPCAIDCELYPWSAWTECDRSCGVGHRKRSKAIKIAAMYGGKQCDKRFETEPCNKRACPVDCVVSSWRKWTTCSRTCGGGASKRFRSVLVSAAAGGKQCPHLAETKACKTDVCPVDGLCTSWGSWESCSVSCGAGTQIRSRSQVRPPAYGGKPCSELEQKQQCTNGPCPIHCTVSDWGSWSQCTTSCGGGKQSRARSILSHPQHGGICEDPLFEEQSCSAAPCPFDCTVTQWGKWTDCTKSCESGMQTRKRSLVAPAKHGGKGCPHTQEASSCLDHNCPIDCVEHAWGSWSLCPKTCGGSSVVRTRALTSPEFGGKQCGPSSQVKACAMVKCPNPVHCLSAWTQFSACSRTCGGGTRSRKREILVHPKHGGKPCTGHMSEVMTCNAKICPVDCVPSSWSGWTACTQSCGSGTQSRSRSVVSGAAFGGKNCSPLKQSRSCNDNACPVNCVVADWGSYAPCPKTCAGATHVRVRQVTLPKHGGVACPVSIQSRACGTRPCPVHCQLNGYSNWSTCSKSCGGGLKKRSRTVKVPAAHGGFSCAPLGQTEPCNTMQCPVVATVRIVLGFPGETKATWSPSKADAVIASLAKLLGLEVSALRLKIFESRRLSEAQESKKVATTGLKVVVIVTLDSNTITAPPALLRFKANKLLKAIAAIASSATFRARFIAGLQAYVKANGSWNGLPSLPISALPVVTSVAQTPSTLPPAPPSACGSQCARNCEVGDFGSWGRCDKSCGHGVQSAKREVFVEPMNGGLACPDTARYQTCNIRSCPSDCKMSDWGAWTPCTRSCGQQGKRTRWRGIDANPHFGGKACDALLETEPCNAHACPVDCHQGSWGSWGTCTTTCGAGTRSRTRATVTAARFGGVECRASSQTSTCHQLPCPTDCKVAPWSGWSLCSKTCGSGEQTRVRAVASAAANGGKVGDCAKLLEMRPCASQACPSVCQVSAWTDWSDCSKTCEFGTQTRTRVVTSRGTLACPTLVDKRECSLGACPVDCKISAWGSWSECSLKCGSGEQKRSRSAAGKICPNRSEKRECNTSPCPVNCQQSVWGDWSKCTQQCGGGSQMRVRRVTVRPQAGGRSCDSAHESRPCETHPCPVHCLVGGWQLWSTCSKTCGTGSQKSARNVVRPAANNGLSCPPLTRTRACNTTPCHTKCAVSNWGGWSACTRTCGSGFATRDRQITGNPSNAACPELNQVKMCNTVPCKLNCVMGTWGAWTKCTKTCGTGTTIRTRPVLRYPTSGGAACGSHSMVDNCNTQSCPVNCVPSSWTGWSQCSASCGVGISRRTRYVRVQASNGGKSCKELGFAMHEDEPCSSMPCEKIDCVFSGWSNFSPCTRSCGGGSKTKHRRVVRQGSNSAVNCAAAAFTQVKVACNAVVCPSDCVRSSWSSWTQCTQTCGAGTRTRTRAILAEAVGTGNPCGALTDVGTCNDFGCPMDCVPTPWSAWADCSATCGAGTKQRIRAVEVAAVNGGKSCGALTDSAVCNYGPCPVHCDVSSWSTWSNCPQSCGGGVQWRTRVVVQAAAIGGNTCPFLRDTQLCNDTPCPVDCVASDWGAWQACSATCGAAPTQNRYRSINVSNDHGGKACGALHESRKCNAVPCAVDCAVGAWSAWSDCSATCAAGKTSRTRTIVAQAAHGGADCPALYETIACNRGLCPSHCEVSRFSSWTACDKSCGGGTERRSRVVTKQGANPVCPSLVETRSCATEACPVDCKWQWNAWGTCSATCGRGWRTRAKRVTRQAAYGGVTCGDLSQTQPCALAPCPVNCQQTAWSTWAGCSKTCGGGRRERTRDTTVAAAHGGRPCTPVLQTQACRSDPCPVDCLMTQWASWSDCSSSCGSGVKIRHRTIAISARHGGKECSALAHQVACNSHACPLDCEQSLWSTWGACSATCGSGNQVRVRTTTRHPLFGGVSCGNVRETRPCNKGCCPGFKAMGSGCMPCPAGFFQVEMGRSQCDSCPAGKFQSTLGQSKCVECPKGHFGHAQVDRTSAQHCVQCTPGRYQRRDGSDQCLECPRDTYINRGGSPRCLPCPMGMETLGKSGQTQCWDTPVPCSVSSWGSWSSCSKTCGRGSQMRSRDLNSPARHGGTCMPLTETRPCAETHCPQDCKMAPWGGWSSCSKTCGKGSRSRTRQLSSQPRFGGKSCPAGIETAWCNQVACPVDCQVSAWSTWTACDVTCGGGQSMRYRQVQVGASNGGRGCPAAITATRACSAGSCPIDCAMTSWGAWTQCSKTCGVGFHTRQRFVATPASNGGMACQHPNEASTCNTFSCPEDCVQTAWGAFSKCSKTCGGGEQTRFRTVTRDAFFGGRACGPQSSRRQCNSFACPYRCDLHPWSSWTSCDKSCGGGTSTRKRSIRSRPHAGTVICGRLTDARVCNEDACPIDCVVADWGSWSTCTRTCGWGSSTRTRAVTKHGRFGGVACGAVAQRRKCATHACPRDCQTSQWGAFAACSRTCGSEATRQRFRHVTSVAANGGAGCPSLHEKQGCALESCPIDCVMTRWTKWTPCSQTCGAGKRSRSRAIKRAAEAGGKQCGTVAEVQTCNSSPCPVDCVMQNWGTTRWGACDATCGGGQKLRSRVMISPAVFGGKICGPSTQVRTCNNHPCAHDCEMHPWSAWSLCDKTCGLGWQSRQRSIKSDAANGGMKCGITKDAQECNAGPCPVRCTVSAWSEWTACSRTCGGGSQRSERKVTQNPLSQSSVCPTLVRHRQCAVQPCPVDCVAEPWGSWPTCSDTCGGGTQTRWRGVATKAAHGGIACTQQSLSETRVCNTKPCPIDCVVTPWSAFTQCSKTCGGGHHKRTRAVSVPARHGGAPCGDLSEFKTCNEATCAIDCRVTQWAAWTDCSVSCGGGTHSRVRYQTLPAAFGGAVCGALSQQKACKTHACPIDCQVDSWGPWSPCSHSCGGGSQNRHRGVSVKNAYGGQECIAPSEVRACNKNHCPIDCEVSSWATWSQCSTSCGNGFRARARTVSRVPAYGGKRCPALQASVDCFEGPCPEHCTVSLWSSWTQCSKSCGNGSTTRKRHIVQQNRNGGSVCPFLAETRECNDSPCPVDCAVSDWGSWTACSRSCGGGRMSRTRSGSRSFGGKLCPHLREVKNCNSAWCPIDCVAGSWASWSACSVTCGTGFKSRTRPVSREAAYGGRTCAALSGSSVCTKPACPVHCVLSEWSPWTKCSNTCGTGMMTRQRTKVLAAAYGGMKCPHRMEAASCNSFACPVNCVPSQWGSWGACSATCGAGIQQRRRHEASEAKHGGATCGALVELKACENLPGCAIDCKVSIWGSWSDCDKSCGGGLEKRSRSVTVHQANSGRGCPALVEENACGIAPCPIDCVLSLWSKYDDCTKTCGPGTQTRSRSVVTASQHGGKACEHKSESRTCNKGPCPIHCEVSAWAQWGLCTVTCGGGSRQRTRTILTNPLHQGDECPSLVDKEECEIQPCPVDCHVGQWAGWSACSASCGSGTATPTQTRKRRVLRPAQWGGKPCGLTEQTQTCNARCCPVDCELKDWAAWGECSRSCASGIKVRVRGIAVNPKCGGAHCGELAETGNCNEGPCPIHCVVSDWGSWDSCSKSCGAGKHARSRTIKTNPLHNGDVCPYLTEDRECNTAACPINCEVSAWGGWHPFSGGGTTLKRTRQITTAPEHGGKPCPPLAVTDANLQDSWKRTCDRKHKQDTYYAWSVCSKSCGTGYQYRYREHVICSDKAAVRYHAMFRQGRHCNTQPCAAEASPVVAMPMQLSEGLVASDFAPSFVKETAGAWRALSVDETAAQQLPVGHWQKYEV